MEKDKSGENAACFDCCFHPEVVSLCNQHKEFRSLVINTAADGVEESYKQQGQKVRSCLVVASPSLFLSFFVCLSACLGSRWP